MAVQTVQQLPAQFIQDIGKDLATQITAQSAVPVVSTGLAGISQQPGESAEDFKARQDAAQAFTTRQQSLSGLAPQVAGQDALQTAAQRIAQQQAGVGTTQECLGTFNAAKGGKAEPVAKKTMPLLDLDGKEMDFRAEGGFVPIGRMEKADDVPARLSKNEFVFTAEAVRNAGEGDVDKGAEVMYNMMKNLEAGGDVSKESQGLEGARRMFQTSQRLEEVI